MADPWEEFAGNYPIHEESYALTNIIKENDIKHFSDYDIEEANRIFSSVIKASAGEVPFDGQVQEMFIPSPEVANGIPVSIYKPSNCVQTPAILIYLHGGGLILFDRKCFEPTLQLIAMEAGCIVVNVEYRLLPNQVNGHAPFDDAKVVASWVLENKQKVGGSPESKVGIGGDSAGGQISASVANDLHGLDFQILIYPNVDTGPTQPSVDEFANVPLLSKADIQWFIRHMAKALPDHLTDPRVNVVTRTDLTSAPSALVLLAQLDTIRDSGMMYAEKLRAAGVKVRIVVIEGVPHCFFMCPGVFKTKCQEAYGHIANFIKDFQ
ncbi:unnamed protein product [Candidula unifasciata]|uniref:Alpha/beta hydrolase fold-3 domain-containing protein n=1 Tax=Candidula unifasciata TaxID=100452 RepID=A0A8S3YGR0_9EUPU|nr:unnamed protein product [Candidula unifasciata]